MSRYGIPHIPHKTRRADYTKIIHFYTGLYAPLILHLAPGDRSGKVGASSTAGAALPSARGLARLDRSALSGLRFLRNIGKASFRIPAEIAGVAGAAALGARFRRHACRAIHVSARAISFEEKRKAAPGALFECGHRSVSSVEARSRIMPRRNASPVTHLLTRNILARNYHYTSDITLYYCKHRLNFS